MAEPKTRPTNASVQAFLKAVPDEARRKDCFTVLKIMKDATKAKPKMWGPSMVGFGDYTYKYVSGRELKWPLAAFSPRKQALTLYIMPGFERYRDLMAKLGKHKTGMCCLYIKRLEDIDLPTLKKLVAESVAHVKTSFR